MVALAKITVSLHGYCHFDDVINQDGDQVFGRIDGITSLDGNQFI